MGGKAIKALGIANYAILFSLIWLHVATPKPKFRLPSTATCLAYSFSRDRRLLAFRGSGIYNTDNCQELNWATKVIEGVRLDPGLVEGGGRRDPRGDSRERSCAEAAREVRSPAELKCD